YPAIRSDQIDITERHLLHLGTDVMDTEHRLLPSHALAPEPEQLQPQVQGELRGVRMERRLSTAYSNQTFQLPECLAVVGQWICEGFLQLRQLPLTAVNGAQAPCMLYPRLIVLRGQQAVNIKGGNALESQHDGMRTQESRELPVVGTAFCSSFEGIPERNVHLIGLIPPVGRPA